MKDEIKNWAVMCCGCFRILLKDGRAAEFNPAKGEPNAKDFPTAKSADAFARKHGWTVEDGNHRCLQCSERNEAEAEPVRRGAYLSTDCMWPEVIE